MDIPTQQLSDDELTQEFRNLFSQLDDAVQDLIVRLMEDMVEEEKHV